MTLAIFSRLGRTACHSGSSGRRCSNQWTARSSLFRTAEKERVSCLGSELGMCDAIHRGTTPQRQTIVARHRYFTSVMVSDLFAGTPPGALVHPDYPVLRAPRGFLVSYSLPPVAIALGRRALDIAC